MAFNRLDESRSSYHGVEIQKRGRSFFRRGESPLSSPLFRRKQFQNQRSDLSISGADSVASSRDSSLDRTSIPMSFHSLVERVRSSPKMTLKQRLQVMRSGSFSDVSRPSLEAKRKRWLVGRSESLRVGSQESPWSSPETDRRGSLPPTPSDLSYSPVRDRSMDRVHKLERRGILQHQPRSTPGSSSKDDSDPSRWKGFVNRWFKHITEANNAFSSRDESQRSSGDRSGTDLSSQNGPLDGSSQPGGASNDLLGGPGYEGGKAAGRSESFKGSKTEGDRGSTEESVSKKTEKLRRKDLEVAKALEEKKQLIAEILNVPKEHFDDIADIASSQPSQDKDAREVLLAALAQAKCLSDLVNQSLNLSDEERILVGSEVSMNSSYTRNTSSSSISTREQQRPLSPSSGISGDLFTAGSGPSSLMSSKPSSSNLTTRNLCPLTLQAAGKFVSISVNLNSHLTTLLGMIQERDEERERMKQELQRSKEQVHAYLSQSTSVVTSSMSAVSPGSRPASFISVEESSGTGDLSEKGTQESGGEDDGALPTNMYENISSSDQDVPEPVTPTNAKPMEDLPASSSDDSPSSPGPYTSLNKEESLENSPSDSDKTACFKVKMKRGGYSKRLVCLDNDLCESSL